MARPWIKLWVEMLSDPKIARLPDQTYRKFIEVLLLAGFRDENGELPPINDIAWMLHLSERDAQAALESLAAIGLVHNDGNDWIVTNFSKRQETPAAARMRKMRAKQKEQESEQLQRNSYGNSYGNDSSSSSASTSLIKNKVFNEKPGIEKLYQVYEAEIGAITAMVSKKLGAAWDEYSHDWFEPAIAEAVKHNARNWAYIEAILKGWKTNGYQSRNGKHSPSRTSKLDAEIERLKAEEANRGRT